MVCPQLIRVRVQDLNPSLSHSTSSSRPIAFQLPHKGQLRKMQALCFLFFPLPFQHGSYNGMECQKKIEINSFLLEFLVLWSRSQFLCEPWFNFYILSLTLTSSQIPFPRILSRPMWWITWFASRQRTIASNQLIIIRAKALQLSVYPALHILLAQAHLEK